MANGRRRLLLGGLGAALLGAGMAAAAQETAGNTIIGPPQLKDFRLEPRERLVVPPPPQPERAAEPGAPAAERRAETRPRETAPPPASARQPDPAPARAEAPPPAAASPQPVEVAEPAPVFLAPAPESEPAAVPAPAGEDGRGTPVWWYALPAVALAFFGLAIVHRRRRMAPALPAALPAAAAAPPPRPRPDPVPRPWLELSLKAERAAFTQSEAELLFELEIANKGGTAARNVRIDVKLFNAGAEQDREIGAFFRTAGRDSAKLSLPAVEAGITGVIHGRVGMPVDQMKALRFDERLLFVPVVAVNALYDWGEGRTGQTSRSYVIGRETQAPGEKMGAFRVDQGPRVWRTVGQRPHKLARRV